jgi:ribonuclease P protein component
VQKTGRRFRGRWLVLVACPGTGAGSRLGFAVSRRVGNAVARNRVKRWLREASREATCTRSWDLVLIANAGAAEAGWLPLAAEVRSLLARAAP